MSASLPGDVALLAGAVLLVAGVLLSGFADRFRAPGLLLFLALGMAVGDDGLGLISFDDAALAQRIGVVALVVILYEGGLTGSFADIRRVAAPASLLATVGVLLTMSVVAGGVVAVTDTPVGTALLIGAVVASTDAAAVFAVLRRAPVPRRLSALLEAESGGNDPMAVLLTVGVLATWSGDPTAGDWVVFGLRQLGGGLAVGATVGAAGALALRRLRLESPALYPVLALGVAGLAYGAGSFAGASGFLAVYVAGLVVGATSPRRRRAVRRFHEGLASVAQISLFLLLGLLVFPAQLADVAGTGLVTAAVLMLVARPLAVATCVAWFGFSARQLAFASWAGLRGAVPIVLATFPLTAGHPDGVVVFDVVFFVVLLSAALQGLTVGPLARRLALAPHGTAWDAVADVLPLEGAGLDVVELDVADGSRVAGRALREVPLPGRARVAAILRDAEVIVPDGGSALRAGDLLVVVAPTSAHLAGELSSWAGPPDQPVPRDAPSSSSPADDHVDARGQS